MLVSHKLHVCMLLWLPCRLIEESDQQFAMDTFGSSAAPKSTGDSLLDRKLNSLKEHEDYARSVVETYLLQHSKNQHYKSLLKALVKAASGPVGVQEVKDLEACLAGVRSDKLKEEKAAKEAKKGEPRAVGVTLVWQRLAVCHRPACVWFCGRLQGLFGLEVQKGNCASVSQACQCCLQQEGRPECCMSVVVMLL